MTATSIEDLVARLSARRGTAREQARLALGDIGSPAVPLIIPLTSSKSRTVRWEATKVLGTIADPAAIPSLVERMADPDSGIRWLAAEGLAKVGPASIPPALRFLINRSDSTDVRRAVHHLLHDLGEQDPDIKDTVLPVMDVLGDIGSPAVIPPKAEEVLQRLSSR